MRKDIELSHLGIGKRNPIRIKNRGIVKNTIPLHKKSIFEGN